MNDEIDDVSILISMVNAYILYGGPKFIDSNPENLKDVFLIACKLVSFKNENIKGSVVKFDTIDS